MEKIFVLGAGTMGAGIVQRNSRSVKIKNEEKTSLEFYQ